MLPAWGPIMSVGLWALTHNPMPSAKFVTATLSCVAAAGIYLVADQMISELKELVTNWNALTERQRGELCGYIIGKYGVDVFACAGSSKLMDTYRNLKRANAQLTFSVLLKDEKQLANIQTRYASVEKFKKDQEYIRQSFGRRSFSEEEIRHTLENMGYYIAPRPPGIPENFITKYSEKGCGISYLDPINPTQHNIRIMPGKPHSPNPAQQTPYIIHSKHGKAFNISGQLVKKNEPEAHIPPHYYIYPKE